MIELWCLRVCLSGSGLSRAEPRPDAIDVGGGNRIRSRLEAGAESQRQAQPDVYKRQPYPLLEK